MSTRFAGKTVLIMGGGSGIGRAVALAFAREGAAVVVAGRTAEPLSEIAKLIQTEGGRAAAITADVTRSEDLARLVAETAATYDRLDIAVNSAGTLAGFGPVGEIDEEE